LDDLVAVLEETHVPFMVGFNRRFSPAARRAKEILAGHQSPLMILCRVNASYLPPDHWTQTEEGGGRIIGEACHMFDLFQYLVSPARVAEVTSAAIASQVEHISPTDNVSATVRYDDGSVATLLYTALGAKGLSKEYVETYADGKVLVIDDYKTLQVHGTSMEGWSSPIQDKGHLEEILVFGRYMREANDAPISLETMVSVTRVSLLVEDSKVNEEI
jgi:predicted dehydrogenase